jgi:hypothetical protein
MKTTGTIFGLNSFFSFLSKDIVEGLKYVLLCFRIFFFHFQVPLQSVNWYRKCIYVTGTLLRILPEKTHSPSVSFMRLHRKSTSTQTLVLS